jgi:putative hemolysin
MGDASFSNLITALCVSQGYRGEILKTSDYANLAQCDTLDGRLCVGKGGVFVHEADVFRRRVVNCDSNSNCFANWTNRELW